ncbi:uncharacterized protein [Venturia canescens]|uniref:uncharacterized protein n=1 Tax=Venturia canescens TaxID=32260 RepID=UPI001C9C7C1E|nr:uncharacterized protein LOC122413820 [Venturia canescens]
MANDGSVVADNYVIPKLDSLLNKKLGKDLELIEYTATSLLPPGENYGSLILKVDAKIRMGEKREEIREVNLIAKIPPLTQRQRDFFDSPYTFDKERFMYEEILPTYRKFEEDCGISDLFDIGPDFYGSRLSLVGDVFDDDAVILMENLKTRGYYTGDRYCGLDIDHARLAVQAMARFHALGIAIKTKRQAFFEVLKVRSKCLEMKNPDEWKDGMTEMYKNIKADTVLAEHYDKCMKAFEAGSKNECWFAPPIEPWSTIIHADFWVNNIMFHRDEETGKPDDVKFVDFQNYLFLSPTRELAFFLGSGVKDTVAKREIDLLIDHYHNTLVERLSLMGCDPAPYRRQAFDQQLSKDAYVEFTHSVFMLKIMTKEVDVDDPNSRNVADAMLDSCSELFYVRLRGLVNDYIERGWM